MTKKEVELLTKVQEHANLHYDGHFVLMKFTGNWRTCFGTPSGDCRNQIHQMIEGNSLEECLTKLLAEPVSTYNFDM
ncbi:hypothetical protein [Sporosarcina cascadiensis]|uniref:hypothetical protein n=1 Tax=Sporosarcina cascadiensis TaxID=2660747 RepID=UPI00129A1A9A|nr:hypothetical protein [Sporosarcina cascadiensis]